MPVLVFLSLAAQLICAVHAVKTGRGNTWLFIILLFPGIGCAAYFFVEMLPDLRHSRQGQQAVRKMLKTLDPEADLKKAAQDLRVSNNLENKIKLAEQCVERGMFAEALDLYQSCLKGMYVNDPKILLGVATCQFGAADFHAAQQTLERLIKENPDFKSQDGHLLYARSLEMLEDNAAALEEYQVLEKYFAGAEAKCRYALLLNKLGRVDEAQALFQSIVDYAQDGPKFYRQSQKQWIQMAKQNLAL